MRALCANLSPKFEDFNDYRKNLKSKPRMSAERLARHSQALAGLLLLLSLSASNCVKLKGDIEALSNALQTYSKHLQQHTEKQ